MYNAGKLEGYEVVDEFKALGDIYKKSEDFERAEKHYRQAIYYMEKSDKFGQDNPRVTALKKLVCDTKDDAVSFHEYQLKKGNDEHGPMF